MTAYINPWLSLATKPPEPYRPRRSMPPKLNAGDKVGRWKLVEYVGPSKPSGRGRWLCQCSCGKTSLVQANNLNLGTSTNCGCARLEGPGGGYGRNKPELARTA